MHLCCHVLAACDVSKICTACNVANAKAYSSGCLVSACNTGWKASQDKAKCEANICSCENGIPSTGAKCAADGAEICEKCNAGFNLHKALGTCNGMFSNELVGTSGHTPLQLSLRINLLHVLCA